MWNLIGGIILFAVAALCIAVGAGTLRDIQKGETQTPSRSKSRTISRSKEPFAFWFTMFTGLVWLLLGIFLVFVTAGGALGLL